MRLRRSGLAALLAICGYFLGTAAAPLFFSNFTSVATTGTTAQMGPVIGVAYADTASDQCASYSDNQGECATGFRLYDPSLAGQTAQSACAPQPAASQADCQAGFGLASQNTAVQSGVSVASDGSTGINQTQCEASSSDFGWITCPAFDSIAHFISGAAKDLMQQFLAVQPLQMSGPLFETWSAIRLLANVAFVIIFLVMIFAHVLQYDLDAYSIKKMIPKIVAGVILVQFSYVLSSALIDIGNILGTGVGSLISSATHGGFGSANVGSTIIEDLTTGIAAGALASLATTVSFGLAAAPIFVAILIAALGFVTTLAVRYFLLGILIVSSPLALAAWVLPNTESFFGKWLSTFVKLVLMYPIIMALLSVAGDVGGLIPNTVSGGAVSGVGNTIGDSVIKLLVVAACFGAVPATFRWAGGAMAGASSAIGKLTGAGLKAHWNSGGTQTRRKIAQENRLHHAEHIAEGLEGNGQGRYKYLSKIPGARTRKWLAPMAIPLLSASPADKGERRHVLSSLVHGHSETVEGFDSAQDSHNLENVLLHHHLGRQAAALHGRTDAAGVSQRQMILGKQKLIHDKLADADAIELLDFTKTDLRREGVMNVLAKRQSLKPGLLESIQKTQNLANANHETALAHDAKREQLAFVRQSFPLYDNQPLVSGLTNDGVLKKENIEKKLRDLDASKIARTFSDRNFEVMASIGTVSELDQAHDSAELFAKNVGAGFLQQNFTHSHRNEMSGEKKLLTLLTMTRSTAFDGGAGLETRKAVVQQILNDGQATHASMLRSLKEKAESDAIALVLQDNPGMSATDPIALAAAAQAASAVLAKLNNSGANGTLTWP